MVHGLKEQGNDETKEQAKALFENFLNEVLEITLDSIKIVDLHRLRQHTIHKARKAITRPIIVKLLTKFDKAKFSKTSIDLSNILIKENHVFSLQTTSQNYFTTKKSN